MSAHHHGGPTPFLDSVLPKPRKAAPQPKVKIMVDNVVPLTPAPVHASEADRRQAAAELLREIAGSYGPRRAHKLRAMADWLVGANAPAQRAAQ